MKQDVETIEVDVDTGLILDRSALPALPDEPSFLPTVKLASACQQIYECRDELVGSLDAESAMDALHRASAIEKYVRSKEHKDIARRAARVLETAVGAALGPAPGRGSRTDLTSARAPKSRVEPRDAQRFRDMAEWRNSWWPELQKKALSRKHVLNIIAVARNPVVPGEGHATITQAEASKWLETIAASSVDLLLTDPPYSTDVDDVRKFRDSWLPLAISRLKPTARAFVFIGAYGEELGAYFSTPLPAGWTWGVPHAWMYKNTIGPTPDKEFVRNWQCMLTINGPEVGPLHSDRITELLAGYVENAPDGRQAFKYHRWEKPLTVIQRLVRVATKPNDFIIDPFSGSGTTLVAAKAEGRRAAGCDVDEKAVAICIERGCNAG